MVSDKVRLQDRAGTGLIALGPIFGNQTSGPKLYLTLPSAFRKINLLNCSGLPAFSSCQFTPSSITFTGNNVQQTAQLQIFTLNAHNAAITSNSGLF